MAAPGGGVLAGLPMARDCGMVYNTSQERDGTRAGHGVLLPQGLRDPEHIRGIEISNGQIANHRVDMPGQGLPPLYFALVAASARCPAAQVAFNGVLYRHV